MFRFRGFGLVLGLVLVSVARAQTPLETDEALLKREPLPTDGKGLLKFFEDQSMKEGDAKRLAMLIKKLDSDVYTVREPAAKELIQRGPISLPFLRGALTNTTLETKRRAEKCIEEIESRMKPEVIAAAARVLAARKEPRGAEVLFNFLPSVSNDPFLEEDLLASVGRLTITEEKVDALLLNALKDPLPFRRQVAAYLVGRRGGASHRNDVRELLADKDDRVRERVAEGLFGKRPAQAIQEALAGDEALLRAEKIEPTEANLLKFFADRTLSEEKQRFFRSLVRNLGSEVYLIREKATKQLIAEGPPVLAFLRDAETDTNVERSARARECIEVIREKNKTAVPIAAAHLLARTPQKRDASPAEAIRALLAYIPFADDDAVEEEALTALTLLCLREPGIEPSLVKALDDAHPARRSAAAFVLGHVGTKEQVARVRPLLDDLNPVVRLRAAQGMLAARDKAALPSFVNLVENAPATYLSRVEDSLRRIAADQGPSEVVAASSTASRAAAAKAWNQWITANLAKIDLTDLNDRESFLGLVTICEYDNRVGNIQGQVSESPRNGPKRWSFAGVMGAMDAHTLPNGRVLVAENSANRITERDTKGEIKWQFTTPTNPICCQRLPNGNTFIASYNMVMEINPAKEVVYRFTPGPQFYIFSAHKAKNGNIVAITAQGQIIEMDGKTGAQKHVTQTQTLGNWCSVELMPNGNYLVASMSTNSVREIDRKGTEVWSKPFPGVFRATRLPNGNVLAASMTSRQVAEIDRGGNIRWSITCTGRPWAVHYR